MSPESKEAVLETWRRNEIAQATHRVLARRGPAGLSMQAIADEAGIAKGTLYLYFEDREALLEHAVDATFGELMARLETVLLPGRPIAEALPETVRALILFFDEKKDFLRAYMSTRYGDGCAEDVRHKRRKRTHYQSYLKLLAAAFEQAAARGEVKPQDPDRLAALVADGISAVLLRRLDERPPRPAEEDVLWISELLLRGLLVAGRKP